MTEQQLSSCFHVGQGLKFNCYWFQVGRSELLGDEEYADIVDDIRDEVERKYGRLARIAVPRPSAKGPDPPGVGLVFLCFESEQGAKEAQSALHGRKFGDNTVSSSYFDPAAFASKQFC